MNPHYYIMKGKKILRLEEEMSFDDLSSEIKNNLFDPDACLNQMQANWRVVIFRDEIMELDEYSEWMTSTEALNWDEEMEYEMVAN